MCRHYPLDLFAFREGDEIDEGAIVCSNCKRWYPIIEAIPHMLPDELRKADEDLSFMERWKEKLPKEIVEKGKPFNLVMEK